MFSRRRRPSLVHCGNKVSSAPAKAAQLRGGLRPGFLEVAFVKADQQAAGLGQQVGPAVRSLPELGHRRGRLGLGQLTPAGMPLGDRGQPGHSKPVMVRSGTIASHLARIEHGDYKGKLP
jgi:hypothetical protein